MADNKVNFLRGTSTEYEAATKDNDTFYYTTDDGKLYLGNKEIAAAAATAAANAQTTAENAAAAASEAKSAASAAKITVDSALSDSSENPGQNKVINSALAGKVSTSQVASSSAAGIVSTSAQTFAGNKTFNGQVIPAGASDVGTAQARKIYAGTNDMTAGESTLASGTSYLVYE